MSDETNMENPNAFPSGGTAGYDRIPGMTLRDYFAAKALPSIIAQAAVVNADPLSRGMGRSADADSVAQAAYEIADAMLKARAK